MLKEVPAWHPFGQDCDESRRIGRTSFYQATDDGTGSAPAEANRQVRMRAPPKGRSTDESCSSLPGQPISQVAETSITVH